MPPWAAIEWARRGESWNVNDSTMYPSSASVAAAEAPARPVPTTMTLNLRLLLGLTSFESAMNVSHLSISGPSGILASSVGLPSPPTIRLMVRVSVSVMGGTSDLDDAGLHGDGERAVADHDDRGDAGGE